MSQLPRRPIIQKDQPLRSQKMLRQAKNAPCMVCGTEDGTVVGAHENGLVSGKGMGIKSDDLVAFLCQRHHDIYDGRIKDGEFDPYDTELMWLRAFKRSVKWMIENGRIKVSI